MKLKSMKLKTLSCALFGLVLACLSLPASAYTITKVVSFPADQVGRTVTFTVKNSAGAVITSGVSGTVVELGGGSYGAAITVPDGAAYFVTWSETSGNRTYKASDVIAAPTSLTTNTDSPGVSTLLSRIGTPAGASVSADIAAVKTSADAGSATATVAALKADSQWQQVVSQIVKIYGAEWGGLIKQSDGSYNVLAPNGTNVIGTVHPFYDVLGRPTNTTKTVNP